LTQTKTAPPTAVKLTTPISALGKPEEFLLQLDRQHFRPYGFVIILSYFKRRLWLSGFLKEA